MGGIMRAEMMSKSQAVPYSTPSSSSHHQNHHQRTATCNKFAVRVTIDGKVLLINVPSQEKTIKWLADEVARRYVSQVTQETSSSSNNTSGGGGGILSTSSVVEPLINLYTADGALLASQDTAWDVLDLDTGTGRRSGVARIEGWKLDPLPDTYRAGCRDAGLLPNHYILTALREAEHSGCLRLANVRLPARHVPLVLRSLIRRTSLTEIDFSWSNIIYEDVGGLFLNSVLPTLLKPSQMTSNTIHNPQIQNDISLKCLYLTGYGLTSSVIDKLSGMLSSDNVLITDQDETDSLIDLLKID